MTANPIVLACTADSAVIRGCIGPTARAVVATLVCWLGLAAPAAAWWNADWSQRARITLDTREAGQPIAEAASGVPMAIRLHSGNFDFLGVRSDGADLRVLAADDQTLLPHRIERFDALNELAVVWVVLPQVLPGTDQNTLYVYAGNDQAPALPAQPATGTMAPETRFLVRFDQTPVKGLDIVGELTALSAPVAEPNALLGAGARLQGQALAWPASPGLNLQPGEAATVSLWLRPDAVQSGQVLSWGPLKLALAQGQVQARIGEQRLDGGSLVPGAWAHVALVMEGQRARLHVNGAEVANAAVQTPAVAVGLRVGEGVSGAIDEVAVAATARSTAWLTLVAAAQGSDGKLVRSAREDVATADAQSGGPGYGDQGYMGILVKNLTVDAWIVIVILMAMFVLAAVVMVLKLVYILRADRDNRSFLQRFRAARADLLQLDQGASHAHSSLYRLYLAGQRELAKRRAGESGAPRLSGASLDAVKASVDADLVRESHKLNAQMVWLTIAISGGPFLGLLGTVVGVMITFAAIAAAGDVNVNAIAPGIAAALLATVAGLAVAIPALFGYNYLASRIKAISADMQIFVDEFITRVAEEYGAQ